MDPDELRSHIQAVSRGGGQARVLIASLGSACWPGGPQDRMEPSALPWLRRWRPQTAAHTLPACSCAGGRCTVCN